MAYNTIVQTGRFTADGGDEILVLRNGIDWLNVYNFTEAVGNNDRSVQFYWQRGMGSTVIRYFKNGGGDNLNMDTLNNAVLEFDSSEPQVGAAVATTASTNAVQPVVTTGSTAGLATGSIVRLINVANVPNICGIDFEIDNVTLNTNFRIRYPLATAPGAAGGAGFYRPVTIQAPFYPRRRFIANISQAAQAVVTMTVTHQFTVGQQVRLQVPAAFGMVEIDNLVGNIVAISTVNNTITLDINSTAFTAFAYPQPGAVPFTNAQVVPVGEDTGVALLNGSNLLDDATRNTAQLGILLTGGAGFPGGAANDDIFWQAGSSFANYDL